MITIGVDAHKGIHMAVTVDEAGREVARWRGPNSVEGWQQVAAWASALGPARRWGIEGAWNYGRGLAQDLVAAGAEVYEVSPRWTAAGRQRARRRDKNDRLDAQPSRSSSGVRARRSRGWQRTTTRWRSPCSSPSARTWLPRRRASTTRSISCSSNSIPSMPRTCRGFRRRPHCTSWKGTRRRMPGPCRSYRAAAVRRLAQRLALALAHAKALTAQIRALAAPRFAPLVQICGVSLLTAGTLAAILGPGRRFASDAQLAAYAGVAPLEASSAERVRHRLNRGGNRQLNAILYRIALTQSRCSPAAQAYLARRIGEGTTRLEAIRALKRYRIRAIWRKWEECQPQPAVTAAGVAA